MASPDTMPEPGSSPSPSPSPSSDVEPAKTPRIIAPPASSAAVRKCMQGNKRANTKPEQVVRAMLRDMGFPGYRLQWKKCPGHPDIAFPGRKIAIFVNGCFWHRCPYCTLPQPKRNQGYWQPKFDRNVERDRRTKEALESAGWTVVVVWEHDLKKRWLDETSQFLYEVISLDEPAERQAILERKEQRASELRIIEERERKERAEARALAKAQAEAEKQRRREERERIRAEKQALKEEKARERLQARAAKLQAPKQAHD